MLQKAALNACKEGLSVLTIVGVADLTAEVPYYPIQLIYGRTIKGTYFGGTQFVSLEIHSMRPQISTGWKSRDQIPKLVDEYLAKELMVDEFISHTMPIESINEAVELMEKGEWYLEFLTYFKSDTMLQHHASCFDFQFENYCDILKQVNDEIQSLLFF